MEKGFLARGDGFSHDEDSPKGIEAELEFTAFQRPRRCDAY